MFGGILFLAILVTLMLQSPEMLGRLTGRERYERAETLYETLDYLTAERDQLQKSIEQVHEQIESLAPPDLLHEYTLLCSGQSMLQQLERQRETLTLAIDEIRRETDEWNRNQELREQRVHELTESLRTAEDELQRYREEMATAVRLPEMRTANTTRCVDVVLRFGKAYFWHDTARLLNDDGKWLNETDFIVVEDKGTDGLAVMPDPLRGLDLRNPSDRQRFTSTLRKFSPIRWRISLIVWDDSFDLFQVARSIAVKQRFEYEVWFGEGTSISDRGGSGEIVVQ